MNARNIKHFILLLLPILAILSSCEGMGGYGIKGTIANAANQQVTLEQSHFDRSNISLGQATTDANGKFELKLDHAYEEGLYRLTVGAKKMYFILNGKEKTIELTGDLNTLDKLDIKSTGSETLTCYAGLIQELVQNKLKNADDARAFVKKGCTPLMQAFLFTQLFGNNAAAYLDDFKSEAKMLETAMPGSKYATDYNNMISTMEKQLSQQQNAEVIKVGQPAPEISLPGPDGKVRSLSALKGKVVLLDFWASWCGPCRKENPHVVEMFHKYKPKGFEIYSVSLDGADPRQNMPADQAKQKMADGKQKWVAAIKQDGLDWDNHVSDLKNWGSEPAQAYGVQSIPKQFLINKDGIIVAINPRDNLEKEILKAL
jgi:thiol-disulfide isomerase/thioredoxin